MVEPNVMSFTSYVILLVALVGVVGVRGDSTDLSQQISSELLTKATTQEDRAGASSGHQEDVLLDGLDSVIRDLCVDAASDACRDLEEIEKHLSVLLRKAIELRVKVLLEMSLTNRVLPAEQQQRQEKHENDKRGRPLSVDAPIRSVSEKVHRQQVRMSLELLRKLGRRR